MRVRYFIIFICVSMLVGFVFWRVLKPTNTGKLISDYRKLSVDDLSNRGLVKVGSDVIKMVDIDFEYKLLTHGLFDDTADANRVAEKKIVKSSWKVLRNQILISMIERKLLFQMSEGDSVFKVTDRDLDKTCRKGWRETISDNKELYSQDGFSEKLLQRLCEQYVVDKYMNERVLADVFVSEKEAKTFFLNNRSDFYIPRKVKIRHIQLADEKTAKKVLYQTRWSNFASMAKKYSIAPEANSGGLLGPFSRSEMPPFFGDAFKMRTKQISQIIKSTYGFHIFLLVDKFKEKTLAFEDVKDDIKMKLLDEKKKGRYQKWLQLALNSIDVRSKIYSE